MDGVGDEEGEFGSTVDDAFLAGFEAWSELGQMQGSLLGGSAGQGGGGSGTHGVGGVVGGAGTAGGTPGDRVMTAISGLGGSMNSFLGEAGLYGDNGSAAGGDSFKDGFDGSGKDLNGKSFGNKDLEPCKMESFEPEQEPNDSEEEEHDYGASPRGGGSGSAPSGASSGQASPRGLGRIFGIGTHPVVAEAQARAEALVHGRGGKGGGSTADAAEKKRKRAVLSKEERAKQNRDRNREHARNTRLRKKAFVEELKKQVEELVASRERDERERRAESRRDSSLRDMRLQVLLNFLEYRGRGETSRQAWQSVLDDQFEMRLPTTPYRSYPPSQVQGGMRVIKGLEAVLADTASLALATRSACGGTRQLRVDTKGTLGFQHQQQEQQQGQQQGQQQQQQQHQHQHQHQQKQRQQQQEPQQQQQREPQLADGTVSSPSEDPRSSCFPRVKREASSSSAGATRTRGGQATSEACSGGGIDARAADGAAVATAAASSGGVGGACGAKSGRGGGFAASVGGGGANAAATRLYYVVDPKEVMVNKNAFMCPFLVRSPHVMVPGMLRCTFSTKSNRLSSLHMLFDPTVPARQLARASLQGRSTQEVASAMQAVTGGGVPRGLATIAEEGSETARASGVAGVRPDVGFGSQDEGVLHSVLEDIREWRVSSTLVDDPIDGKSFLRVYPLNGDTPGVTHFIGVLEGLTGGATLGAVDPAASASGDAGGDHAGVGEVRIGGAAGEETSSREAGTSEGETSSDSTSSAGRRNSTSVLRILTGATAAGSGESVGSDDGSGGRGRISRSLSAATTTAGSDGGASSAGSAGGSGYETRRSVRRLATSPNAASASGLGAAGTRVKARSEGAKRART